MDLDRAVRLRELWNGSFGLNLIIRETSSPDNYVLCGTKEQTPATELMRLQRLAVQAGLELIVWFDEFTID